MCRPADASRPPALRVRLSTAPEDNMAVSQIAPECGFEPRIGRSVSLDHAAQLLGVSRRTIYNRIREGRLQTIRTIGGSQRVLVDSMQASASESFGDSREDKSSHLIHGRVAV